MIATRALRSGGRVLLVGCALALLAACFVSLSAIFDDPPQAGDPPTWTFVALAGGGACLAASAAIVALRKRSVLGVAILALAAACLLSLWVLTVLYAG